MASRTAASPLYRLRLWMAKRRRHLNHWTLLRRSRWCVSMTKRQLSLLSRQDRLIRELSLQLSLPEDQRDSSLQSSLNRQLSQLMLEFPLGLSSPMDQATLEELQLVCRELTTALRRRS